MAEIVSIANQKGGVGKTTTAINLAVALAAFDHETLLIDFDPQSNSTSGLGVDTAKNSSNIYDVLCGRATPESAIKQTSVEWLDVIPTTHNLAGAEIELVSEFSRESALKRSLDKIKEMYKFIILDCPPSLGLLTINALTASDSVITPVQCEFYAMEGLSQIVRTIKLVQKGLNPGLRIEGIVLTMFDGRNNLSRQVEEEVRAHFGEQVFKTVIPRNVRLSEAPSHGRPIILYDIASRGAVAYLELAGEVIARGGANG